MKLKHFLKVKNSPLKIQVTFGAGAPAALQVKVASFPSNTVKFFGPNSITGWAAKNTTLGIKTVKNTMFTNAYFGDTTHAW